MKVSSIELFDKSKQYIYATRQGNDWVLPPLSAKNLLDLDVAASGFLTNQSIKFENDKLVFSVSGDNSKMMQVEVPSDYKKYVESGLYDSKEQKLVLTNNDTTTITIDLSQIKSNDGSEKYVLSGSYDKTTKKINFVYNNNEAAFDVDLSQIKVTSYSFVDTSSINFTINQGSLVSADVIISDEFDNKLSKKEDGLHVDATKLNHLLFRIPVIEDENVFQNFYIQFSKEENFSDTLLIYNTKDNSDLFRVFTGYGISVLPVDENKQYSGINYIFSDYQLQFDLNTIDASYKYFRFHWTSDDGVTFGRYGYGNRQAVMQIFDSASNSSNDSSISNKVIQFTSLNSDNVVWNDSVAVFTHNMNCVPIVTLYNSNMIQIMCDIQIIDGNTFSIDFQDASIVDGTWKMILSYGTEY